MKEYKIVLASASPRRQELLSQIGLSFVVLPSHKEERITQTAPEQIVQELSRQKAEDIFEQMDLEEQVLVIGADTIVACDGQILGKPKDKADAVRMLSMLQGRSHQVYTGVTVLWRENGPSGCAADASDGAAVRGTSDMGKGEADRCGQLTFCERTEVSFFPMSREEIAAYVDSAEPMDKAGAYGIQGRCAAHISGICGDYNNVVGLPVGRLYQELQRRGLL